MCLLVFFASILFLKSLTISASERRFIFGGLPEQVQQLLVVEGAKRKQHEDALNFHGHIALNGHPPRWNEDTGNTTYSLAEVMHHSQQNATIEGLSLDSDIKRHDLSIARMTTLLSREAVESAAPWSLVISWLVVIAVTAFMGYCYRDDLKKLLRRILQDPSDSGCADRSSPEQLLPRNDAVEFLASEISELRDSITKLSDNIVTLAEQASGPIQRKSLREEERPSTAKTGIQEERCTNNEMDKVPTFNIAKDSALHDPNKEDYNKRDSRVRFAENFSEDSIPDALRLSLSSNPEEDELLNIDAASSDIAASQDCTSDLAPKRRVQSEKRNSGRRAQLFVEDSTKARNLVLTFARGRRRALSDPDLASSVKAAQIHEATDQKMHLERPAAHTFHASGQTEASKMHLERPAAHTFHAPVESEHQKTRKTLGFSQLAKVMGLGQTRSLSADPQHGHGDGHDGHEKAHVWHCPKCTNPNNIFQTRCTDCGTKRDRTLEKQNSGTFNHAVTYG
mmetsp:Transcript_16694/g.31060  ORF Transcript_16694/g.31060 Transcript_16694/m.31060 type:complete len:509 (+) Transcript_16694:31-1557(+)